MANFYLDETLAETRIGASVRLTGSEARHAAQVARTRVGDELMVGNGRGLVVRARATSVQPSAVELMVDSVEQQAAPTVKIALAQALAKGDRDELAVQAATELGIDVVIPWQAERSVPRWGGEKAEKGRERWAAIAREASKQAVRPWLPEVLPLVSTTQLGVLASSWRLVVLEPDAREPLASLQPDGRGILLVVGPEGGIAPAELEALQDAGGELRRLGGTVLRTSTAGPAALAVLNVPLARW
ncbi:16S rRNA (uracil(1498)-N(3))-methyltransferase [Gryllotalpicola sp.]|uniref:16S rRNA (uracil(1498)-N(3))-methyltransferase n=1 Tax=Gryllotalpicola sp. TaxID=1932787 RepID=UPI002601B089|nr:16S rRNA (uracil(1498)-N(3))-methyltransferase [Gryllotalpicola sp.]